MNTLTDEQLMERLQRGQTDGWMFGFLHGILTCPLALSQHVTGLGITLLGTSFSYYAFRLLLPDVSSPPE